MNNERDEVVNKIIKKFEMETALLRDNSANMSKNMMVAYKEW